MTPDEWRRFGWGLVASVVAYTAGWLHAFAQFTGGPVLWPLVFLVFGLLGAFAFGMALKGGA